MAINRNVAAAKPKAKQISSAGPAKTKAKPPGRAKTKAAKDKKGGKKDRTRKSKS